MRDHLQSLLAEIADVYKDVTKPSNKLFLHPDCFDDGDLLSFYEVEEGSWTLIPDAVIAYENAALSFASPVAFRYLIPAYMSWSLRNLDSGCVSLDHTLFTLSPKSNEMLYEFTISKYTELNRAQCQVVVHFLEYVSEHGDEFSSAEANEALSYWLSKR